jgi:hypothetical protein
MDISGTGTREAIEREFRALADQWHEETGLFSSVPQIAMHPAYQRIIGMGRPAIPLILEEMRRQPGQWFWALRAITGELPVPDDHRGRVQLMVQDWLEWGKQKGYIY